MSVGPVVGGLVPQRSGLSVAEHATELSPPQTLCFYYIHTKYSMFRIPNVR